MTGRSLIGEFPGACFTPSVSSVLRRDETPALMHTTISSGSFHLLGSRTELVREEPWLPSAGTGTAQLLICVAPTYRQNSHFLGLCYNEIIIKTLGNVYCTTWNQDTVPWSPASINPGTGSSFIENFMHLLLTSNRFYLWFLLKLSFVCNTKLSCSLRDEKAATKSWHLKISHIFPCFPQRTDCTHLY